jgi:hypothetical protein
MSDSKISRRLLLKSGALTAAASTLPAHVLESRPDEGSSPIHTGDNTDRLPIRMLVESLPNPLPPYGDGFTGVWTRKYWEGLFSHMQDTGHNALVYYANPWTKTQWQSYMIMNREYPEAQEHPVDDLKQIIEHVRWIFRRAREFGIQNYLFCHFVYTPMSFARKHGYERDMTISETVHGNHNNMGLGEERHKWGVRNELTRGYTEAAIAEVLDIYPELDGLMGTMGESMPGRRSTWYREAIVPGMLRCGRSVHPPFILFHWIMPFEEFMRDIAPASVYDNTWLSIEHNGEQIDSARPYPTSMRWAEESGMPTIVQIVDHNVNGEWYRGASPQIGAIDSPKLAWEIMDHLKRLKNCVGYNLTVLAGDSHNLMFKKALAEYSVHGREYSDEPWLDHLESRYGNREAAGHILKSLDVAARITPEVGALAWCPHDTYCHARLSLRFWFFDEETDNFAYSTSPARGLMLLPVRYYARAVARNPARYRDNDGSRVHAGHTSQELIWGHIDYGVTPEAHMRKIKAMGRECREAMEAALPHVTRNMDEAQIAFHYMKSHELLTIYYEKKVLAAIAAQVHRFGQKRRDRKEAEKHANEAVTAYEEAIGYVKQHLDENRNRMRSKWGNEYLTLDQLVEYEKKDRDNIATLFRWPAA